MNILRLMSSVCERLISNIKGFYTGSGDAALWYGVCTSHVHSPGCPAPGNSALHEDATVEGKGIIFFCGVAAGKEVSILL